jgi:hypothetical protein
MRRKPENSRADAATKADPHADHQIKRNRRDRIEFCVCVCIESRQAGLYRRRTSLDSPFE